MSTASDDRRNTTLSDAIAEAEAAYRARTPKSAANYDASTRSMPGGNTRSVLHFAPYPLTFTEAEGATLTDADGHRYRDFLNEYTAALYGHSDPVIRAAIEDALGHGIVRGGANQYEAAFSAEICERFPAIDSVRFCNSGTEANLYALQAARTFTGRSDVIVMQGGYHGGVLYFAGPCPLNVPIPFHAITYNDIDAARATIREMGGRLAAVILEPMLGSGGCIAASPEFLSALREETERAGALLIFDEVMTSRLSEGGLHGRHGLKPDLVTLGKYVGGGVTFGAFGGRADIMAHFDPRTEGYWPHAGTFNNNALSMAAGLAGLTRVFTRDRVAPFNAMGDRMRERLAQAIEVADVPMAVQGIGSMMAFHYGRGPFTEPGQAATVPADLRALIHFDMLERGFYYARRGMMALSLPLTDADCDAFADAMAEVLALRAPLIRQAVENA